MAVESGGYRKSLPAGPESVCPPVTPAAGNGGLVPPERPPKKPHLRAACATGTISPDQEMLRIEASAQELMNLNPQRSSLVTSANSTTSSGANTSVPALTNGKIGRKPPAPDPPGSSCPPQQPVSSSPVQVSIRSPSPDLPPPPPPSLPSSALEEVADDPLPPPPPPHLIHQLDDGRTQSPPTYAFRPLIERNFIFISWFDNSVEFRTTYHQESYMVHRKTHSPNGAYHRRSADNLLITESSLNSAGKS